VTLPPDFVVAGEPLGVFAGVPELELPELDPHAASATANTIGAQLTANFLTTVLLGALHVTISRDGMGHFLERCEKPRCGARKC
jgi:hypothetical protein